MSNNAEGPVLKPVGQPTFSRRRWLSVGASAAATVAAAATVGCQRADFQSLSGSSPIVLRLAHVYGPSELCHLASMRLADTVRERTGGSVEVRLYPAGQLGDEREAVEALSLGAVDLTVVGCSILGNYAPEYGLIEAPFLFRDFSHVRRVWEGEIGREIVQVLRQRSGVDVWDIWYRGPRYLTTTDRRIHTPQDLVGMKLRVPELDVYIQSWRAFGANTTPLPFGDLFMALRLGVVDGQENPLATIAGNHLQEVQRYIMETQHLVGFYLVAAADHLRSRLSTEQMTVVRDAIAEATTWHNAEVLQTERELRHALIEDGAEFVPVDRAAFKRIAADRIPSCFAGTWQPGLYERIQSFGSEDTPGVH